MQDGGHIVTARGHELPWTAADALWLRRAVEREGEPREWVAQALVNRWALLKDKGGADYPTLASFVRAYAQPVNPRWYPDGDRHLAALAAAPDEAKRAALIDRAQRRRDAYSVRKIFQPETEAAVARALKGPITLPAGVTEYATDTASARRRHGVPMRAEPGENAFWSHNPGVLYGIAPGHPTHPAGRALRTAGVHAGFGVVILMGLLLVPFVVSGRRSRRIGRRSR